MEKLEKHILIADLIKEGISGNFLDNLLAGNKTNCSLFVKKQLEINPSIIDLYEDILKGSLYEVGLLWETNKISVATEHMATAITEGILNELFEQVISKKRLNKKVVVTCVENESHQVGIKMVADVFEINGWDSFFLGTGIPTKELFRFIKEQKPDILAISLSIYFNFGNLLQLLKQINIEFPDLQIIVGGQAFSRDIEKSLIEKGNVITLSNLYMLDNYIKALNTNN